MHLFYSGTTKFSTYRVNPKDSENLLFANNIEYTLALFIFARDSSSLLKRRPKFI